ncbi:acetyl-CoA carboxylase biotin carboxyl carrier protein [Scopulibacillus daqui]|uniref:Biotin carboxyl carrier protein of acetyl-CoA carboxylase n=1 Tax=Scopulibacillus daqui TaxID=1469162 RepID=A0ABS2Q3R5_9BACL|nr:acetyl-CoA carboxylase biotin carboxyl carrier protein [Scopulibacillus daqui]MBM7646324.1 acetyl-CoA carboxylase biotin carboxyl carrier protein [Scopulibacillus daqui]
MLKIQEIKELIKLIDESTIDEFKYELDESKITIKKAKPEIVQAAPAVQSVQPVQPVQAAPAPKSETKEIAAQDESAEAKQESNLHKIESPMVGTFYAASNPDSEPFVKAGSKVDEKSVVCIVEAMKLFNEIEAEIKGEIVEVLVEDGQLVEYGQPLFLVKPE